MASKSIRYNIIKHVPSLKKSSIIASHVRGAMGQTERNFKTKCKERRSAFILNKRNAAFASHYIETSVFLMQIMTYCISKN